MERFYNIADRALDALKAGGADNARCTLSHRTVREFNVDNGKFSLYRTLFSDSVSLTAICGGKKGAVAGNSLEDSAIDTLCADCLAVASSAAVDDANTLAAENKQAKFTDGCPDCDEEKLFFRCREFLDELAKRFPKIHMEQMIVSHSRGETLCADLSGSRYERVAGCYNVDLMYSAHDGEKSSSFFGSGVITDNLDVPFMKLCRIADELAEVERQIDTMPVDGKFIGDVVLPVSSLGSFLHDAISSFATGSVIYDGTSPWKDSLGKQVASESLTVVSDPRDPSIVCGSRINGEGFVNEKNVIIEKGVLKNFVMGRYYAKKTGNAPSGNTENNYIVDAGDKSLAELVKGIKKGLWVGRISGGSPAVDGTFSAVAKNSFLIEDGEIKQAVSETMINGNLREMLMNIKAVSADRFSDGMTTLPCIIFSNITISGK